MSWVGCNNDRSNTVPESDCQDCQGCTCTLDGRSPDQELFNAPKGLVAWGSLPDEPGGKIEWLPGINAQNTGSSSSSSASSTRTMISATTRSDTSSATTASTDQSISRSFSAPSATSSVYDSGSFAGSIDSANTAISPGAISGIVIGVMSGLALLGIYFTWMRKKRERAKQNGDETLPNEKNINEENTDLSAENDSIVKGYYEAGSVARSELPDSPATTFDGPSSRNSVSSQSLPPSPMSKEQVYYRPYKYQPAPQMQDIQEMPGQGHVRAGQTDPRLQNQGLGLTNEQELNLAKGNVHELPG